MSAILVLIGLLLAPIGLVAATAKQTVSDTDSFVAAFSPLASEPEFKAVVVDVAVAAISNSIDTDSATNWIKEHVESLGLSNGAQAPLDLLLQMAPNRLQSFLASAVADWVDSDQFRSAWELVLRGGHSQWVAILEQDANALLAADPDGFVMLQVWPVIPTLLAQQNQRITEFIASVPAFTYEIPLRQGAFLDKATDGYSAILVAGTWLPWISLAFASLGVVAAVQRRKALVKVAFALAGIMGLLVLALHAGRALLPDAWAAAPLSGPSLALFYDAAAQQTVFFTYVIGAVSVVIGLTAWGFGAFAKRN